MLSRLLRELELPTCCSNSMLRVLREACAAVQASCRLSLVCKQASWGSLCNNSASFQVRQPCTAAGEIAH